MSTTSKSGTGQTGDAPPKKPSSSSSSTTDTKSASATSPANKEADEEEVANAASKTNALSTMFTKLGSMLGGKTATANDEKESAGLLEKEQDLEAGAKAAESNASENADQQQGGGLFGWIGSKISKSTEEKSSSGDNDTSSGWNPLSILKQREKNMYV